MNITIKLNTVNLEDTEMTGSVSPPIFIRPINKMKQLVLSIGSMNNPTQDKQIAVIETEDFIEIAKLLTRG